MQKSKNLKPRKGKNGLDHIHLERERKQHGSSQRKKANIDSDHAPVWVKRKFKFKKIISKGERPRTRVEPLKGDKREDFNKEVMAQLRAKSDGRKEPPPQLLPLGRRTKL